VSIFRLDAILAETASDSDSLADEASFDMGEAEQVATGAAVPTTATGMMNYFSEWIMQQRDKEFEVNLSPSFQRTTLRTRCALCHWLVRRHT